MTLPMPEALGVDASAGVELGSNGNLGLDAPIEMGGMEMASFSDFQSSVAGGTFRPYGFTQMMNDLTEQAYNTPGTTTSGQELPTGTATGTRGDIVKYAEQFLGMQYKWGGSSPQTSFDCSGFIQYVMKQFGVSLPRISADQARSGKQIGLGELQAGDLVAWDNSSRNNGADHIALYIGNGQIMEFYKTGKPSRIRKLGKGEGAWGVQMNIN